LAFSSCSRWAVRGAGMGAVANLRQAEAGSITRAVWSGALFNLSNILVVVAIDAAGMAVAFPIGVGLALVIGTVASYVQAPEGNPVLLSWGVGLVLIAIVVSAIAHSGCRARPAADGRRE